MQIQLRQKDIEAALRMYIAAQGIVVAGKDVTIDFTVKRKQGGIIADVTIEDNGDIPGFTDSEPEGDETVAAPRINTVLRAVPVEAAIANVAQVTHSEEAIVAEAPEPEGVIEAPKPKTSSLFGS